MKKVLSLFLSILMLFSLTVGIDFSASAAETQIEYDIVNGEAVITAYYGYPISVTIPSYIEGCPVTRIGSYAFAGCVTLNSITLPDTMRTIEYSAFTQSSINSINFGKGLKTIEFGAFWACNALRSVSIPGNVKEISNYAFYFCKSLNSIKLGNGIKTIGQGAFMGCALKSVTIPKSVTKIGTGAFSCDTLTSISVDSNNSVYSSSNGCLLSKDKSIFYQYPNGNTKTSYTVPSSVERIESSAFNSCLNLKNVTISDNVTEIGSLAFSGCSYLKNVTMPKSLKTIGNQAFYMCNNLDNVWYKGNAAKWNSISIGSNNTPLLDAEIHFITTKVTKATTKKNGSAITKCSVCGAVKSKSTVYSPKTVTLSTTSYTYNGKVKTPSVTVKDSKGKTLKKNTDYTVAYAKGRKSVGKYTVTIKFKGSYSGTVTKTFTIKPKSTSISKLTAGKKKLTVKWKKQATQTTGYQIQYSTSSKFTSKTTKTVTVSKNKATSKTISKLTAKKKYYVRVRTYKTVKINGKNTKLYSSWSKAKAVTTKK